MKNNLLNKEIYVAKCIGYNVYLPQHPTHHYILTSHVDKENKDTHVEISAVVTLGGSVLKRPLSSMTLEEGKDIAILLGYKNLNEDHLQGWIGYTRSYFDNPAFPDRHDGSWRLYQYLEEKQFALPYYDLSVVTQIEYDWLKLKTS